MTGRRHRRPLPTWLVVSIGVVLTFAGVLWSSSLYDDHGEALLDGPTSTVLVALLGLVGTLLTLVLQRTRLVEHQLKPNSGSSARDSLDRTEHLSREALTQVAEAARLAESAVKAAQKAAEDTAALRREVQQVREDLTGTAADLRGIRRDIGRLADAATN